MNTLREAAQAALEFIDALGEGYWGVAGRPIAEALRTALARSALDEVHTIDAALAQEEDKTAKGLQRSELLGGNVKALVDGGVPFLQALAATLKTYDHPAALVQEVVDPTDPGHDVNVLREQVRHLERRVRELHALAQKKPEYTECARLRAALHEIAEEWAGAECGEPVHAQEAYAIGLAKRMYALAAEGLK